MIACPGGMPEQQTLKHIEVTAMATQFAIYKCGTCGNRIEVLFPGDGEISCCGAPMKLMKAAASDGAKEKHVPVLQAAEGGCKVIVGSAPHVMEEKHWIEWIEVTTADGKRYKQILKPGDAPEATFPVPVDQVAAVYEYCNLHGLWTC